MTTRVTDGAKPIREWLDQLHDKASPVSRRLLVLYGGDETLAGEAVDVCKRAVQAFEDSFGGDRSAVIVEPGLLDADAGI